MTSTSAQNMRKKRGTEPEILLFGLTPRLSQSLKQLFQRNHYIVHVENVLDHALSLVQTSEISVVLYDQDSKEAKDWNFIRRCSKLISHPSIIALTRENSVQNIRALFGQGAIDCLIKPPRPQSLMGAVEKGIETRTAKIYGIKDVLTGLYNRYAFKEILRQEIDRAQRYDRHLSLLMIDIDHFKSVNDLFGHVIGDQVLEEFSDILKSAFRKTDIITRFGGEEFAIILPETTIGHATMLAERIRKSIEEYNYSHLVGKKKITVSIGISNYHTPGQKSDATLIHSADKALFAAKKEGRNKVCISV